MDKLARANAGESSGEETGNNQKKKAARGGKILAKTCGERENKTYGSRGAARTSRGVPSTIGATSLAFSRASSDFTASLSHCSPRALQSIAAGRRVETVAVAAVLSRPAALLCFGFRDARKEARDSSVEGVPDTEIGASCGATVRAEVPQNHAGKTSPVSVEKML
jgi:hypothetical protein